MIDIVRLMTRVELTSSSPGDRLGAGAAASSQPLRVMSLQKLKMTLQVRIDAAGKTSSSSAAVAGALPSATASSSSSTSSGPSSHSLAAAFLAEFGASDLRAAWAAAFSQLTILPLVTTAAALHPPPATSHAQLHPPPLTSTVQGLAATAAGGSFFVYDSPAQHDIVVPTISGPCVVHGVESAADNKSKSHVLLYTYSFDYTVPNLPVGKYAVAFRVFFRGPPLYSSMAPSLAHDGMHLIGSYVPPTSTSTNLQFFGTMVLPVELGSVMSCAARGFAVQPHRVIIEVDVKNTSNRAITVEGINFDLKSTWIGPCKGSLENVPSLPEQRVAPKAIDIAGVELLESCVVLAPLNVNDTTPLLQPCEQYSFLFSISLKPHLVHLVQKQSLADELAGHLKHPMPQASGPQWLKGDSGGSASASGRNGGVAPTTSDDAGDASSAAFSDRTRRITELLAETFISSIYVQHSAMNADGSGGSCPPSPSSPSYHAAAAAASSELEMETTVVWSFRAKAGTSSMDTSLTA